MLIKTTSLETLSVEPNTKIAKALGMTRTATVYKNAHRAVFDYEPRPGFLYVRSRAISSRCNDNYDEFPAAEIEAAYKTFIGKPVFVNHHNEDHKKARGVIIDAALHKDTNADGSPDTWAEVLMEVDAVNFPKLAQAILAGHVDRTSMGCDVGYSVCSACGNKATTPSEYCSHIPQQKGALYVRRNAKTGSPEKTLIREICYKVSFFENSLLVEEPADPTALAGNALGEIGLDWYGKQKGEPFKPVGLSSFASLKTTDSFDHRWYGSSLKSFASQKVGLASFVKEAESNLLGRGLHLYLNDNHRPEDHELADKIWNHHPDAAHHLLNKIHEEGGGHTGKWWGRLNPRHQEFDTSTIKDFATGGEASEELMDKWHPYAHHDPDDKGVPGIHGGLEVALIAHNKTNWDPNTDPVNQQSSTPGMGNSFLHGEHAKDLPIHSIHINDGRGWRRLPNTQGLKAQANFTGLLAFVKEAENRTYVDRLIKPLEGFGSDIHPIHTSVFEANDSSDRSKDHTPSEIATKVHINRNITNDMIHRMNHDPELAKWAQKEVDNKDIHHIPHPSEIIPKHPNVKFDQSDFNHGYSGVLTTKNNPELHQKIVDKLESHGYAGYRQRDPDPRGNDQFGFNAPKGAAHPMWKNAVGTKTHPEDKPPKMPEDMRHVAVAGKVRETVDNWAASSGDGDPHAHALQIAVHHHFGLDPEGINQFSKFNPEVHKQGQKIYEENKPFYHHFADSVYKATQKHLKDNHISHLNLHRGMKFGYDEDGPLPDPPKWSYPEKQHPYERHIDSDLVHSEIHHNPISSWTGDPRTAKEFADANYHQHWNMLHAKVPASRIWSLASHTGPGSLGEREAIVLHGKGKAAHERYFQREADDYEGYPGDTDGDDEF